MGNKNKHNLQQKSSQQSSAGAAEGNFKFVNREPTALMKQAKIVSSSTAPDTESDNDVRGICFASSSNDSVACLTSSQLRIHSIKTAEAETSVRYKCNPGQTSDSVAQARFNGIGCTFSKEWGHDVVVFAFDSKQVAVCDPRDASTADFKPLLKFSHHLDARCMRVLFPPPQDVSSSSSGEQDVCRKELTGSRPLQDTSGYTQDWTPESEAREQVCFVSYRTISFCLLKTGVHLRSITSTDSFYDVACGNKMPFLAAGHYKTSSSVLRVFKRVECKEHPEPHHLTPNSKNRTALDRVAWAKDDSFVLGADNAGQIFVFDTSTWKCRCMLNDTEDRSVTGYDEDWKSNNYLSEHQQRCILDLALGNDSRTAVTACGAAQGGERYVSVYDIRNEALIAHYKEFAYAFTVAISADSRLIAIGRADGLEPASHEESQPGSKALSFIVIKSENKECIFQERKICFLLRESGKCKGKMNQAFLEWNPMVMTAKFLA